jgi:hypothetical protein
VQALALEYEPPPVAQRCEQDSNNPFITINHSSSGVISVHERSHKSAKSAKATAVVGSLGSTRCSLLPAAAAAAARSKISVRARPTNPNRQQNTTNRAQSLLQKQNT